MTNRTSAARRFAFAALTVLALAGCDALQETDGFFNGVTAENNGPLGARAQGGVGGTRSEPVRGFTRIGAAPENSGGQAGDAPAVGSFTINFERADLREVVRTMIEDGLGANYIIDDTVSGTVTIRTNNPLTEAQIVPVLEEILRLNGAALIERAGVFQIIPAGEAGRALPSLSARAAEARGLTLRVTPLQHVDTEAAREVLDAFAPVNGSITYDGRRNLVFTIGSSAEQASIADILDVIDQPALSGRAVSLRPVRNADAADVVREVELIRGSGGGTQLIAIERLNAVLILSQSDRALAEVRDLVARFDQGPAGAIRLHSFKVQNRRATEVAPVIADIIGVELGSSAAVTSALSPSEDARVDGDDGEVADEDAAAAAPAASASNLPPAGPSGVARLAVDNASNSIFVYANEDGARIVSNLLRRIDVQALQVMIQATLAEVTLTDDLEFGVRFFLESGDFSGGFSDATSGSVSQVFPGFNAVFQTENINGVISALDQVTTVKMISSPTLMVQDSQPARLQIGDQVPVTTRASTSVTDPDAPIVTETEFRDTGVILSILPQINANGLITLQIRQEVSSVAQGLGDAANPTFSQRVVESTVLVDSGDTIAVAGLIQDDEQTGQSGLPGVRGIFGNRNRSRARTELIVLLTPSVIRDQRSAREATSELSGKLQRIFGSN